MSLLPNSFTMADANANQQILQMVSTSEYRARLAYAIRQVLHENPHARNSRRGRLIHLVPHINEALLAAGLLQGEIADQNLTVYIRNLLRLHLPHYACYMDRNNRLAVEANFAHDNGKTNSCRGFFVIIRTCVIV